MYVARLYIHIKSVVTLRQLFSQINLTTTCRDLPRMYQEIITAQKNNQHIDLWFTDKSKYYRQNQLGIDICIYV